MAIREKSVLTKILELDALLSKHLVSFSLQFASLKSLRVHCKFLELSCHGIIWLATWIGFIWIINSPDFYEMQLNLLMGLILDIIIVAISKAVFRRRRPIQPSDMLVIGSDKYSFPSGHSSRATLILLFFIYLYPISVIFLLPLFAWSFSVSLSRLLLQRHYILDVIAGCFLGCLEILVLNILWISKSTSINFISYISNDYGQATDE